MARTRTTPPSTVVTPSPGPGDAPPAREAPEQIEIRDLGDLESLDGAAFDNLTWYVYRLDDGDGEAGGGYIAKIVGRLDLDRLREQVGGGRFRLFGKFPSAEHRAPIRRVVTIVGPRLTFDDDASAPASTPPRLFRPAAPRDDEMQQLRADLDELRSLVREIPTQLRALSGNVPSPEMRTIADVLGMVKEIMPQPPDPAAQVAGIMQVWERGVDAGRRAENGGGGFAELARELAPLVGAFLQRATTPTPAPEKTGAMTAAPAAPIVVAPPARSPANGVAPDRTPAQRVNDISAALALAIQNGASGADLADLAEQLCTPDELDGIRAVSGAQLLELIPPGTRAMYPALQRGDVAEIFEAMIRELRTPAQ